MNQHICSASRIALEAVFDMIQYSNLTVTGPPRGASGKDPPLNGCDPE